jgi:uronate dehydrogenase
VSGRVLVTGAAGTIGSMLRAGLLAHGWALRLLDVAPLGSPASGEELLAGDIRHAATLARAMADVDAVVHLAGIPTEAPFADLLETNIAGTYEVFEAARRAGVRRVVFASSNHAVGFTPRSELAGIDVPPRPDTYYGVTKVFGEALGRLYVDRYGLQVAALRIGTCRDRPVTRRHLSTWLSPDDVVRLVHACLTAPELTYAVVYGISANTRRWWDLEPGRALGYEPEDDAEAYVHDVLAGAPPADPGSPAERYVGGEFAGPDYDLP